MKVAESSPSYELNSTPMPQWVEVLVDCPYAQGLYTYKIKPDLHLEIGDIVSVPFGQSIVGGIVLKLSSHTPSDLPEDKIKEIDDLIAQKLFPPHYWQLLQRTASYYFSDLITVVKTALPPKLLGKSQTRVRLLAENIPDGLENFCSPKELEVLKLLQKSKSGDYTHNFINQKIRHSRRAISQLVKRQWVETYLKAPSNARPKYTKVVTFLTENTEHRLTPRQRDVLTTLKNNGGELPLADLRNLSQLNSNSVVQTLANKGCVVIQERETLRLLQESQPMNDTPKAMTQAQSYALEIINSLHSFATVLLHGVTGSGKLKFIYKQSHLYLKIKNLP